MKDLADSIFTTLNTLAHCDSKELLLDWKLKKIPQPKGSQLAFSAESTRTPRDLKYIFWRYELWVFTERDEQLFLQRET